MKTCALFTAALVATAAAQDAAASKKCAEAVTTVLALGALDPGALTCSKDSGVSTDPTSTPTEADLTKMLATKSCTTWWDGVVEKVKAISPPCDFPTGATSTINTAKFNWTLKDLYAFAKSAAAGEPTTTKPSGGATPKPGNGTSTTGKPDTITTTTKPTGTTTAPSSTPVPSSAVAGTVSVLALTVASLFM
ncbi:hypothetical protein H310_04748 [Aphanomyces invadans]|uniref:Secreted protein n=1 Tax=Aphanomyces invadans TaxID=157072 RepID=A0A024UDZ8_9STRA|nr:hypothetical protein H310_04748 [Aphanomyces invadans]ETW04484.1 hypothetical protein H310_04748 [Aphanomyces invadans]|eukprot:XP_008867440.1 hypothetical protein H310_04748 [Aphanomyces invadans]